jgi:hypothetical protein
MFRRPASPTSATPRFTVAVLGARTNAHALRRVTSAFNQLNERFPSSRFTLVLEDVVQIEPKQPARTGPGLLPPDALTTTALEVLQDVDLVLIVSDGAPDRAVEAQLVSFCEALDVDLLVWRPSRSWVGDARAALGLPDRETSELAAACEQAVLRRVASRSRESVVVPRPWRDRDRRSDGPASVSGTRPRLQVVRGGSPAAGGEARNR